MFRILTTAVLFLSGTLPVLAAEPARNADPWWWDDAFWEQGQIPVATNHPVETRWIAYKSGDNEIPALLARPNDRRKYPGVLFMHGRRGLDALIQL